MSDHIRLDDFEIVDFSDVKKKNAGSRHDFLYKILKIVIGVLILFLAVEILYYICVIPAVSSPQVIIEGSTSLTREDVAAIAGISQGQTWLDINADSLTAALSAYPLFESARAVKYFPDKLRITVQERKAVATSLAQSRGKTVPVQIDKNGVMFKIGGEPLTDNCVMLSGLSFENVREGDALPEELRPLMDDIAALKRTEPSLLSTLSEIKIEPKAYNDYDLILYPSHAGIRIRVKRPLNSDALKYMMLLTDVLKKLGLDIEEVDIRAGGAASYRVKEAAHE